MHYSVPDGFVAALYVGTHPMPLGLSNIIGRWLGHGPISHTELVRSGRYGDRQSMSSSYLDGGVRTKQIDFTSEGFWEFIVIPDPDGSIEAKAIQWYKDHNGAKYDTWAIIRLFFGLISESVDKFFCNESNMNALGYPEDLCYKLDPNAYAELIEYDFKSPRIKVS